MFNIGMGELALIVLLVLVVVGPERLPGIMRQIGKYAYQLRTIVNELTDQFSEELRPIQELQQLSEDLNPVKQVTKVAMSAAEPLQKLSVKNITSVQPPASSQELVKPASKPAAKPTSVFHAAPPRHATNPIKVIAQAKQTPESSPEDAAPTENDS